MIIVPLTWHIESKAPDGTPVKWVAYFFGARGVFSITLVYGKYLLRRDGEAFSKETYDSFEDAAAVAYIDKCGIVMREFK